jgi:hypothetical protein
VNAWPTAIAWKGRYCPAANARQRVGRGRCIVD